jgi:hypothetical protein
MTIITMDTLLKLCELAIHGVFLLLALSVAVYTITAGFVARAKKNAEEKFAKQQESVQEKIRASTAPVTETPDIELLLASLNRFKDEIDIARQEQQNSWLPLSFEYAVRRPARLSLLSLVALVGAYVIASLGREFTSRWQTGLIVVALIAFSIGLYLASRVILNYLLPGLKQVDRAARIEEIPNDLSIECYFEDGESRLERVRLEKGLATNVTIVVEHESPKQLRYAMIDFCFQPPLEPTRTDRQPPQNRPTSVKVMPNWKFYTMSRAVWAKDFYWRQTFGVTSVVEGRFEIRIMGQSLSHEPFIKSLYVDIVS